MENSISTLKDGERRVGVCDHTKKEVIQQYIASQHEWLCLHNDDSEKDAIDVDMFKNGFTCTDPDTMQFGKHIRNNRVFEFVEGDKRQVIDIAEYTKEEIESTINSYGYTLTNKDGLLNVYDHYGSSANWIIAECLFEQ